MPNGTDTADEQIDLVEACQAHLDAFLDFARECLPVEDNPFMVKRLNEALRNPQAALVRECDEAQGRNLPEGYVPTSTYWLVRNGRDVVARSTLRHRLNAHLEHEGGHIGYSVRPSDRRRGYGTAVCRLTLAKARALGLARVLITCDDDNIASARVIEKNGGRFENAVRARATGKMKRRYWIAL